MITIDKSAAEQALAEIGETRKRSARLYGYRQSAPYLFITGVMWLVADLAFHFAPAARDWIWPVASTAALPFYIGVAVWQSLRARRDHGPSRLDDGFWKSIGIWLIIVGFVAGTFIVFSPIHGVQIHSFIGLVMGAGYAVGGLFAGRRFFILGLAIALATIGAHLWLEDSYTLFMGLACGGGMMLGSWWLRSV